MEVEPTTIGRDVFGQLVQELSCQPPASIALELDKCGAHLPVDGVSREHPRLEEELRRLSWTIAGCSSKTTDPEAVLGAITQAPITHLV